MFRNRGFIFRKRLYIQLWYSTFQCTSISSLAGRRVCSIQLFFTGAYCKYSIAFWTPNGRYIQPQYYTLTLRIGDLTCQQGSASQWKETEKKEATYIVVYGHGILSYTLQVRVTILAISHQLAPAEAGVRSQKGQYGLRGGRRGTWDRFLSENVYTPPVSLQQWSILKQHSSTIIATNLSNW